MECNHFFLFLRREGMVSCNNCLFFSPFFDGFFFCSLLFILVLLARFSTFSFPSRGTPKLTSYCRFNLISASISLSHTITSFSFPLNCISYEVLNQFCRLFSISKNLSLSASPTIQTATITFGPSLPACLHARETWSGINIDPYLKRRILHKCLRSSFTDFVFPVINRAYSELNYR